MANPSILAVFERMWQHIIAKVDNCVSTEVFYNHIDDTNNPNPHGITKDKLNLENVDNTSDLDKPISNAVQTALDEKANGEHSHLSNDITWSDPLPIECGGTGCNSLNDTIYTTPRYRASMLVSTETTSYDNGVISWVYE